MTHDLKLRAHREAMYRQLHRMRHAATAMEDYVRPRRSANGQMPSRRRRRRSVVGIFAGHYSRRATTPSHSASQLKGVDYESFLKLCISDNGALTPVGGSPSAAGTFPVSVAFGPLGPRLEARASTRSGPKRHSGLYQL
jgi:hypothetical protein